MSGQRLGPGYVVRREPYEIAVALGCAPGVWLVPRVVQAVAVPRWGLVAAGVLLSVGAVLTLWGLLGVALETDDVRRVVARHVEQAGQITIAGMLGLLAAGTGTLSGGGAARFCLEVGCAVGAAARAVAIGRTFKTAGRFV